MASTTSNTFTASAAVDASEAFVSLLNYKPTEYTLAFLLGSVLVIRFLLNSLLLLLLLLLLPSYLTLGIMHLSSLPFIQFRHLLWLCDHNLFKPDIQRAVIK